MNTIKVNMLSIADVIKGQGVETAYNELTGLLDKYGKDDIDFVKNKGLNYDIMHMHTVNPISYIKQRLTKGTTLTYVHFMPNSLEGTLKLPKFCLKVYSWWVKKCYLKSDYLVVVNPEYIQDMVDMGYDRNKIFYIPNIVSSDKFKVFSKKENLNYRRKYGYSKDDFIVICVGQLHKAKGVLDFIEIAKNNPDIKFIWVGGFNFGPLMEGYKKIKEVYNNPYPNLRFTGIVDRSEVNTLLNISDVFFLPSYYESFGLVVLEAAFTNKPIVLRDLEIYRSIYNDNYLCGKNNKEFIKLIRLLKDDKKIYNKYVNCSKKIKVMYNEKSIYNKWKKLYSSIKR